MFFGGKFYFWLIRGLFCFFVIFLLFYSFIFVDDLYLGGFIYIDILSYSLIILRVWVRILIYFSSFNIYKDKNFLFLFSLLVFFLCLILFLTFRTSNLLMFYFYFEASLVPTLLIIMGWGYQPERLQAGIYFLFYTLMASLPLLLILVYTYNSLGRLELTILDSTRLNYFSLYIFIALVLAFLVKIPIYFTHLWLPKAHVEAPVSGSMILAGVLLKLGGYGFYRVLILCLGGLKIYSRYFFGVRILGIIYVGFMCCRLNDLKALVAYSSVAHMALVICGVFRIYLWGFSGGLVIIVAHGLASSGLFCIVNIYYERRGRRRIYLNKGLILILPLITLLIFILCAANIAAPPSLNLLSEIFLMIRILKFDKVMLIFFPLGSYLGAVFTLFLFSFSQHGKAYQIIYSYLFVNLREIHVLSLHIIPVNLIILKSDYFLYLCYLSSLLENLKLWSLRKIISLK